MLQRPIRICVISSLLLVTSDFGLAGDWDTYSDRRVVDPTGRYYAVIKKTKGWTDWPGDGGPVEFVIAERGPNQSKVAPASDYIDYEEWRYAHDPNVKVRKGDRVLGKATLKLAPNYIHVSATGLGIVALDVYGYKGDNVKADTAVIIIANDGTIRHRKSWADLFTEDELPLFETSSAGTWWLSGSWIDEINQRVVVAGRAYHDSDDAVQGTGRVQHLFRAISIKTGDVESSDAKEIVTAIRQKNLGGLPLALEFAAALMPRSIESSLPGILNDHQMPLRIRLRAAVALAAFGDHSGARLIKATALKDANGKYDNREYAIEHLVELVGEDAATDLQKVLKSTGETFRREVWSEFGEIGESAIPTLIEMLKEESTPVCQYVAAECLGGIGPASKDAVPLLIKNLEQRLDAGYDLSTHLVPIEAYALSQIGPDASAANTALSRLSKMAYGEVKKAMEDYDSADSHKRSALIHARMNYQQIMKALRAITEKTEAANTEQPQGPALPDQLR